jgi:LysR family hydrogen peroxide-inducible transcriptional activator
MTLEQLKYALALQKLRNFSRAAEHCHITQPSLSTQISKLEDELGLRLFDRGRSGVQVTEYGEAILAQARKLLDESERVFELAHELKGEVQGTFRLGIIPTLAPSLLPLFVGPFGKRYPKVRLRVIEEPTSRLVQAIDAGDLDAAILSPPAQCPDSIVEKALFYEPFVVFASSRHAILKAPPVSPKQLSAAEVYLLDDTHCLRDQVLQLCKLKAGSPQQKLQIQSGSLQTLVEVLRREEGYTLLPSLSERFLSASERERHTVAFAKPVPSRKISLVFSRARAKRSIMEALRAEILSVLPDTVHAIGAHPRGVKPGELKVISPADHYFEI